MPIQFLKATESDDLIELHITAEEFEKNIDLYTEAVVKNKNLRCIIDNTVVLFSYEGNDEYHSNII